MKTRVFVDEEKGVKTTVSEYESGGVETIEEPLVQQPKPMPEPTEQEILQAEMLLNQQQIISKQTEIDMTLAELLLNQQGVDR